MPSKRRATIEDLRLAIDCLPRTTRVAMLEGIRSNDIVVGAYSHHGGICPMLAAHRAGGRTNLISFARAWDRFAFGHSRRTKPRPATARELTVLASHLEASLLAEEVPTDVLGAAIAAHGELVGRRRAEDEAARRSGTAGEDRAATITRPGDPDRSRELHRRPGWRWMRLVRRYDDYQAVLEQLRVQVDDVEAQSHAELVS